MKELKGLKFIVMFLLSVMVILSMAKMSYATSSDDFFSTPSDIDDSSDSEFETLDNMANGGNTNTNTSNTNTNTSNTNTNTNNSSIANNVISLTNNTTNNNTVNRVVSQNELASTGLADNGGIVALVVLISGISAIYSFKKINEYKKL